MKNLSLLVVVLPTAAFALAASDPHHHHKSSNPSFSTTGRRNFLTAGAAALGAAFLPKPVAAVNAGGRVQYGDEDLMRQKGHGSSESPVQADLMYGVDNKLADKIWYVFSPLSHKSPLPPTSPSSSSFDTYSVT
jgi:hypothetical protein